MDELDFRKFLSANSAGIMENQSKRIENRFTGNFTFETLTVEILAEVHNCINDYLKAYNTWLFNNFDISPKEKN